MGNINIAHQRHAGESREVTQKQHTKRNASAKGIAAIKSIKGGFPLSRDFYSRK